MLREIHILRGTDLIYWRQFGDAIPWESLSPMLFSFANSVTSSQQVFEGNLPDFMGFKISYSSIKEIKLLFVFVSDVLDSDELIRKQLKRLKNEFQDLFSKKVVETSTDPAVFESLNPIADIIHKDLRPKISLVGFSGVGKTTITRLIRAEEIPKVHNPTMTGDIHTIKIGKLHFNLWDFAGQEQFSFLWPKFVKDSDAVLIVTDSTLKNIEKSKFFLKLANEKVPTARLSVIANKQDLPDVLTEEEIENLLNTKTYGMIAVDPKNRAKMIEIIANTLGITQQVSPLIKPLLDRDKLVEKAEQALLDGDFQKAIDIFENIAKFCLELEDSKIANEFFERARFIKSKISGLEELPHPKTAGEVESTEIIKNETPDASKSLSLQSPIKLKEPSITKPTPKTLNTNEIKPEFKISPTKEMEPRSKSSEPQELKVPTKIPSQVEKKPEIEVTDAIDSNEFTQVLNKLSEYSKKVPNFSEKKSITQKSITDETNPTKEPKKRTVEDLQAELKDINKKIAEFESKFQQKDISENEYQENIELLRSKRKDILYRITQMKI